MGLTTDGVTRILAGTILKFRTRGAARGSRVEHRHATSAGIVLQLADRRAGARATVTQPGPTGLPGAGNVDSILVAVLRDSVARGEYQVDADSVARKMIAAHGL
jgi:anti-sigma28 factor (negative regulator of flagellin synthesis)